MDSFVPPTPPFTLTADQRAIVDMARGFADDRLAPQALAWDAEKHFPT